MTYEEEDDLRSGYGLGYIQIIWPQKLVTLRILYV